MSRYQPPHLRQQQTLLLETAGATGGQRPATSPVPSGRQSRWAPKAARPSYSVQTSIAGPSRSDTGRAHRQENQYLASPATDLKPLRPMKEWSKPSEMEMLASVPRSGGDGQEGDALKSFATQQTFRKYIDERLSQHYIRFGTAAHTEPAVGATEEMESLKSIVLLFRKLREGVTASHRLDAFAIEVYESSALLAILTHDASQLVSTLGTLVPSLYKAYDKLSSTSIEAAASRLSLEGDRRALFTSLFLLYHICHLDSLAGFWSHHREITSGPMPFVPAHSLGKIVQAAEALSIRSPNPRLFCTVFRDPGISLYEHIMLSWAETRMRDRGLAVLRKAYIDGSRDWVYALLGFSSDEEWSGWLAKQGLRLEADKVKFRS